MNPDGRYVRVYYEVLDDPKFADVYPDDARFATWVRLLMDADNAWPAPAPIPRSVDPDVFAHLVEVGLVETARSDHFRIHGLDGERARRAGRGAAGGKARAKDAVREGGRFAKSPPANDGQRSMPSDPPASRAKHEQSRSTPTLDARGLSGKEYDELVMKAVSDRLNGSAT